MSTSSPPERQRVSSSDVASQPGASLPPTEPAARAGGRSRRRVLAAVLGVAIALVLGFLVGWATGSRADAVDASVPVLDAEFDFIGAVHTWEEEGSTEDPFADVTDGDLLRAGRTACLRATDPDMSFNGMLDVLGTSPHQTYAILAEASDKLCPSHGEALAAIMDA